MPKTPLIIGVAGGSGSGKTTLALNLNEAISNSVILSHDYYYKDNSNISFEERVTINYDHPNALDHDLLVQHLTQLVQGDAVNIPQYSYTEHTRLSEVTAFAPRRVIILEGILLLTDSRLRELMDASIFMDTPLDICLLRRLVRDVQERGRTMDSVLKQYQKTVRPMFMQFIDPSKQYADVIVPRGGKNRIAIDMLKARIRHMLIG